ncbi:MAG: ThuA domain-containing protein, partial [Planctomycetota bacterium]
PPETHEYYSGLHVLEKCLADVPNLKIVQVEADEPCPQAPELIDQADGIVLYLGEGGRWMQLEEKRREAVERLAARGGGIVGLHWGIGAKDDEYVPFHVKHMGGMHGGSDRTYVMTETDVKIVAPQHPIARDVHLSRLEDEYYYQLKFAKEGTVAPILEATIDGQPETIAWAYDRADGGRSFGFGGMHYHANWAMPDCRRLVAQGVLWTLRLPIPEEGLECQVTEEDLRILPGEATWKPKAKKE